MADWTPLFSGRHAPPAVVAALLPHLAGAGGSSTLPTSSLYANLPPLCSWLFGSSIASRGVIHSLNNPADEAALAQLLRPPNGALFRAILAHAHSATEQQSSSQQQQQQQQQQQLYEVQISMLPKPTQSLLDAVERSELPSLLRTRVHGLRPAGPGLGLGLGLGLGIGDGSHVLGPATGDARIRIKFTICEYFLFCFLLAGTTFPATPVAATVPVAAAPRPVMTALSGALPGAVPPPVATPVSPTAFYLDLFLSYARFFLPPEPGRAEGPTASGTSPRRPSMASLVRSVSFFNRTGSALPSSNLAADASEPSVFTVLSTTTGSGSGSLEPALALSEFFVDTFAELFLGQNPLLASSNGNAGAVAAASVPQLKDPYVKPPMVVINAADGIVRMLMSSEVSAVEVVGSRVAGREPVQSVARKRACMAIKWKLYSFLRLAFVYCPEDEYFDALSKLYADYLAPWVTTRYDASYHPLLADRFLFYTSLLRAFLERAGKADPAAVLAQLRTLLVSGDRRPLPDIIATVVGTLANTPEVIDVLRTFELAIAANPRTPAEHEAKLLIMSAWQGMPATIRQFELTPAPIWTTDMAAAGRVQAVLAGALRLLEQQQQQQQQQQQAASAGSAAAAAAAAGASGAPAAAPTPATAAPTATPSTTHEDISARLHAALDLLQATFNLAPIEDPILALRNAEPEDRRIVAAAPEEEPTAVSSPASKFFPHLAKQTPDGRLTARGRYMVRHGLAKTSNLDVPVLGEELQDPVLRRKRERMVADHESALLVSLFAVLGNALHRLSVTILLALADRYPNLRLPSFTFTYPERPHVKMEMLPCAECANKVSFRWLRWFASYQNLVLVGLILFSYWLFTGTLRIVWKILVFMLSGSSSGGGQQQQQIPVRRVGVPGGGGGVGGRGGYPNQRVGGLM